MEQKEPSFYLTIRDAALLAVKQIAELREELSRQIELAAERGRTLAAANLQISELRDDLAEESGLAQRLGQKVMDAELLIGEVAAAWKEQKSAVEANVPSGEFGEDDLRGDRVLRAKKQLVLALDAILTPKVQQKCERCGTELPANESHGQFCKPYQRGDDVSGDAMRG